MVNHDRRLYYLTQYICELALLQAEMGQYSPAEVAASAILLSRLLVKMGKFVAFKLCLYIHSAHGEYDAKMTLYQRPCEVALT